MKKKKNKVIDNKQKKKLIITSIFMLFLVIVASFAYYEMNSTESITSIFTSNFGETGGVTLSGPTPNLHIKLTNKDMHYTKEGTSYFATDDNNKNYDTTPVERTIAKIEAVDTNPTYTYYCRFKLAIDVRDSKNNKFKTGDAILHLSGHYEADLDLSNYETPIDIEYFLDQDNTSKEIKAVLEVKNTTNNQSYAEGIDINIDIYNSNLVCDHEKVEITDTEWVFDYTGGEQVFVAPYTGTYKVELWGAQGGSIDSILGGSSSFVTGTIQINKNTKLYLYIGGRGTYTKNSSTSVNGGYNGGGNGRTESGSGSYATTGGGSTDIRLINGNWDNDIGLKSRIIVAAGGGGSDYSGGSTYIGYGGAGGGLSGYNGTSNQGSYYGTGATQLFGGRNVYLGTISGSFGKGGNGQANNGSGGSGYYGGGSGQGYRGGGGGGSSFISGHNGCVAIESSTSLTPRLDSNGVRCTDGTTDIECSKHYSGYVFTDTVMIDGAGYSWTTAKGSQVQMPKPDGTLYPLGQGHTGNGYARITFIE